MSQKVSRRRSRILDTLLNLDEFVLNSQVRVQSETAPRTFWDTDKENQEGSEDLSRDAPHPEVGTSVSRSASSVNSAPDASQELNAFYVPSDWSFSCLVEILDIIGYLP